MSKRRRLLGQDEQPIYLTYPPRITSSRPIDKTLLSINASCTSQCAQQLVVLNHPCTVTGLRWSVQMHHQVNNQSVTGFFAIVVVRAGSNVGALNMTNLAPTYTPEQNVLAFWTCRLRSISDDAGPLIMSNENVSKTRRRLREGDSIYFCASVDNPLAGIRTDGIIQMFCIS